MFNLPIPLPSLQTVKIVAIIAGVAAVAIGSAWTTHQVDQAHWLKIEAGWKDAKLEAVENAKKVQAAEDKVSLTVAVNEAAGQQKVVEKITTVVREVQSHVPNASKCAVTVGFVRVLNAAVLGVGATDLSYAAGQPDDACAPTDPRTLVLNIIANYQSCLANAQQLGSLQGWVQQIGTVRKDTLGSKGGK